MWKFLRALIETSHQFQVDLRVVEVTVQQLHVAGTCGDVIHFQTGHRSQTKMPCLGSSCHLLPGLLPCRSHLCYFPPSFFIYIHHANAVYCLLWYLQVARVMVCVLCMQWVGQRPLCDTYEFIAICCIRAWTGVVSAKACLKSLLHCQAVPGSFSCSDV